MNGNYSNAHKAFSENSNAYGKAVIDWIQHHDEKGWSEADVKILNLMVRLIWNKPGEENSLLEERASIRWNMNKPADCSELKWRRIQLSRYLKEATDAKGNEVQSWIFGHNPNPWPNAAIRDLNKMIRRLRTKPEFQNQLLENKSDPS